MKKLQLIIVMLFSVVAFAQEENNIPLKNYETHRNENIQNSFYYTNKQDSIIIGNNLYFFKISPITFVDGYEDFICSSPMILPRLMSGYTTKWQIEKGNLYISDISPYMAVCKDLKDNKIKDFLENKSIARDKLEKLTGSQYNNKGLLPTEWVNGEFLLYKYPVGILEGTKLKKEENYIEKSLENKKRIAAKQEIYVAVFEKGKLKSLTRNTELEKKYREFAKRN